MNYVPAPSPHRPGLEHHRGLQAPRTFVLAHIHATNIANWETKKNGLYRPAHFATSSCRGRARVSRTYTPAKRSPVLLKGCADHARHVFSHVLSYRCFYNNSAYNLLAIHARCFKPIVQGQRLQSTHLRPGPFRPMSPFFSGPGQRPETVEKTTKWHAGQRPADKKLYVGCLAF
jgi:hypothetical protein